MLTFRLPLPPSINSYFRMGRGPKGRAAYQKFKAWKEAAGWDINRQRIGQVTTGGMPGNVAVHILFERTSDIDNRIKPLLDLLQEMAVFANDRQIVDLHAQFSDITGCIVSVRAA